MKLFTKRRGGNTDVKSNAISKSMNAVYKHVQGSWANWMMKHTENFSRRTWLIILTLFVMCSGAFSVYLAVNAFTRRKNSITITPVKKLKHATETGEINIEAAEISEAEYNRIRKFRIYMDSLARSPFGKIMYDNIILGHPGLMDSVRLIENYYQQLKRK